MILLIDFIFDKINNPSGGGGVIPLPPPSPSVFIILSPTPHSSIHSSQSSSSPFSLPMFCLRHLLLPIILLFLSSLLVLPSCSSPSPPPPPPSLALRLSPRGLAFFSSIGHRVVERALPSAQFPPLSLPINAGPGSGQVNVSDLRIPPDQFHSPHFRFDLSPPNAIRFVSQGGNINVRGMWHSWYELIGITFYSSGWVDLIASDIRTVLLLGVVHSGVHPQLRVFNCTADVGRIQVQIGGGVIPWLVNLFRSELGDALIQTVHTQLCPTIQTSIVAKLNSLLASYPTRIPIGNKIFVEYAIGNDTQVTSSFVQSLAFVRLLFSSSAPPFRCPLSAPSPLPLPAPSVPSLPMASLWLDHSLFACLLRSLHHAQLLQLLIGPSFDSGHFAKFLRTSCAFYQLCLGRFLPLLALRHPDQHVDLLFHSASAPSFLPFPPNNSLALGARFFVDLYISPWKIHAGELLARLEMNASIGVVPRLDKGRIGGLLEPGMEVHFAELNSSIGNFSQKFLDTFALLIRPALRVALQSALRVGLPLPAVEGIRMANGSTVTALEGGELRVDAELEYVERSEGTEVEKTDEWWEEEMEEKEDEEEEMMRR